jgi:hypothetical protein
MFSRVRDCPPPYERRSGESLHVVPAKAGIQVFKRYRNARNLGPGLRRNDVALFTP